MSGGVIIVGAGIAGLATALALAPLPVTLVTAGRVGRGGASRWAQGGLAAAIGADDTPEAHLSDTIAAGAGLVDAGAARVLCEGGPNAIAVLDRLGVPFDRHADGAYSLGREAAHGAARIVHVGGDEAGATIMAVLTDRAREATHITIAERTIAYHLCADDRGICALEAHDAEAGEAIRFTARHVILATGGIGGLYAVTTNPLHAQGHGLTMAYRAGATIRDAELVQFHPTALDIGVDPAPLATEALRGAGATLHDAHGRRFMPAIHPDAELGPRDVVARGVAGAIKETGFAFLDTRTALGAQFAERFPTVWEACREGGINPITHPIPIAPAAHYHMGGIRTDLDGRSDVEGLFAVGECASTGVHGANRLASNSLLEAIVFGHRCADAIRGEGGSTLSTAIRTEARPPTLPLAPARSLKPIRAAMSAHGGLLRDEDGLDTVLTACAKLVPQTIGDDLALGAARLVIEGARTRTESRGAHQRTDYPDTDGPQGRHEVQSLAGARALAGA